MWPLIGSRYSRSTTFVPSKAVHLLECGAVQLVGSFFTLPGDYDMTCRFRFAFCLCLVWLLANNTVRAQLSLDKALSLVPDQRGVVALVGLRGEDLQLVNQLAQARELTVYFQSADANDVLLVRQQADAAGLLGKRVFADVGNLDSIHLSHNLADAAIIEPSLSGALKEDEVLRVVRPQGKVLMGSRELVKPNPEGMDDWSHPYHGPDNNTQSNDKLVRGEFQTQFIADPKFSPMPEQSVIAGGRIYKAMGHIAHKANQNEMLNTLLCINAYNGMILWRRPLSESFMLHRNTMIATDDGLYMGDHESCKYIDAITGQVRQSLVVPKEITDGPVWKWMAIQGDTLYALVGNLEVKIETLRSDRPGIGHWPWGMWDGHDYKDPRTAFGHGRTLVAMNRHTGKLLWHYRDTEFLDARAMCMKGDRIYCFCAEKFLACIDAQSGKLLWKNSDEKLLAEIGPNEKAQHYITGYATTAYMKCSDDYLFFAGPQRKKMVVASATDGSLLWTNNVGNLQLVLRAEAIFAAGPQGTRGMLLDYKTGAEIASLPARRACTRATGCADSIFFRASGGTVRVMTDGVKSQHIAPMRPPCQDGVLVSNGHLYWGPWMCGCQLSLYGNIGLRPIAEPAPGTGDLLTIERDALTVFPAADKVRSIGASDNDWTTYRSTNSRTDLSKIDLANRVQQAWSTELVKRELPTAPVAAGGLVFVADRSGTVQALDANGRQVWKAYTGGPVFYPPTVAFDRLFVGSADGRVYCFEAATGRALWKFRVAPEDRRIHVFNQLVSRWPVAGGVAVEGGKVYAAAGITHYDGTYVVALDALTGKLHARNSTSGKMSDLVNSGVSMQGEVAIVDGELQFAGGGIYEVARYDLNDLKCLNDPRHQLSSEFRTAFYAWYPTYNKFVSLECALPDKRVLCYDAAYDGSAFGPLALENPRPLGKPGRPGKDLAGEFLRRRGKEAPPKQVWRDEHHRRFTSFAVCRNALLASGHIEGAPDRPFLVAIDLATGKDLWKHDLPADTVKGGLAVNAQGQIYAALENGQLHSFHAVP